MLSNPKNEDVIITLTTDFGNNDPFCGIMKGVILSINNSVKLVDITHNVPAQDIFGTSHIIRQFYSYFPIGTIHLIVVDPGVGSKRRAIIVKTKKYFFVAPDNGVLSSILKSEDVETAVEISNKDFILEPLSNTFHGRDIFAPTAAWLSKGVDILTFGQRVKNLKILNFNEPKYLDDKTLSGSIVQIDIFGNLYTNISDNFLKNIKDVIITIKGHKIKGVCSSYEESDGNPSLIINSVNVLEIFVLNKSAKEVLNIDLGEAVTLSL